MRRALFAIILLLTTGGISSASVDGERYLRGLVERLASTPGWQASVEAYTSQNETSVARGVVLSGTEVGITLAIDSIAIADFQATGATAFRGSALRITGLELTGANFVLHAAEIDVANLTVPEWQPFEFDAARPFTSYFRIFTSLSAIGFTSATIPEIRLEQTLPIADGGTINQVARYTDIAAGNISAGVMDVLTSGEIALTQTGGPVAVEYTIETTRASHLDLTNYFGVFTSTKTHPPGAERPWIRIADTLRIGAIDWKAGQEMSGQIAAMNTSAFDVREPERPVMEVFEKLYSGAIASRPEEFLSVMSPLLDLYGSFRIGEWSMDGLSLQVPANNTRFAVDRIIVQDASAAGIGRFGLEGFALTAPHASAVLDRLDFGDIGFPDKADVVRFIELSIEMESQPPDEARNAEMALLVQRMIPSADRFLLASLLVQTPMSADPVALKEAAYNVTRRILGVPVSYTARLDKLAIPVAVIPDPQNRFEWIRARGVESFVTDMAGVTETSDEGNLHAEVELRTDRLFEFAMSADLAGWNETAIQAITDPALYTAQPDLSALMDRLSGLLFGGFSLAVTDRNLVAAVMDIVAKDNGLDRATYTAQLKAALPFFLGALQNPDLQASAADALGKFLDGGHTLTLAAEPVAPVPVPALIETGMARPFALFDLVGFRITAEPVN